MEQEQNEFWWQSMVDAIRHGLEPELTRLLLEEGELNQPPAWPYEFPLLCEAARIGDISVIERLLEAGADIDVCDPRGISSLHWAAKRKQLDAAQLFMRKGADATTVTVTDGSPLIFAALNWIDPTEVKRKSRNPPWLDIAIAMLEAGADGELVLSGASAFEMCQELRAEWEHVALARSTALANGEPRIIRRP